MRKFIVFIYKVKDSRQSLVCCCRRLEPTTITYIIKNVNESRCFSVGSSHTHLFLHNLAYRRQAAFFSVNPQNIHSIHKSFHIKIRFLAVHFLAHNKLSCSRIELYYRNESVGIDI